MFVLCDSRSHWQRKETLSWWHSTIVVAADARVGQTHPPPRSLTIRLPQNVPTSFKLWRMTLVLILANRPLFAVLAVAAQLVPFDKLGARLYVLYMPRWMAQKSTLFVFFRSIHRSSFAATRSLSIRVALVVR